MLRKEVKEALILLAFSLLMQEVLTPVTIALTFIGTLVIFFRVRPGRVLRNVLALGVLASYWFTYGKVIDPEVGVNFLTTVVVLKLMEKETERDHYMVFFGLILAISVGALFERTLTYLFFYAGTFLLLLRDFYRDHGESTRMRDIGILLLWILPLTFCLFLFVPRAMNPIPFNQGTLSPGEIGYTPTVNFTSLQSLSTNEDPAFHALVDRPVSQGNLYWRGNTISLNDGWNWSLRPTDRSGALVTNFETGPSGLHQSIRVFTKEEFLFSLDRPLGFILNEQMALPGPSKTALQDPRRWMQRYGAISLPGGNFDSNEEVGQYLRVGLSKEDQEWIRSTFKGKQFSEIVNELQNHFRTGRFEYTLRPGLITSFRDFMQIRRAGFCSHYASAVGLIMRTKNVPARLVAGFMGGNYNPFGKFYLVSQNDAHVWVEVLSEGRWVRIDPTEWVAPDRVRLGGEAYMSAVSGGILSKLKVPGMGLFQDLRLWFGQWDFQFYQWLERVDYHGQEAWLSRLKFKREWFYTLAPLALLFFTLIYLWQIRRKNRDSDLSESARLWELFQKKLRKRDLILPLGSVSEADAYLKNLSHPERDAFLEVWQMLVEQSFATDSPTEKLYRKIKSL